jgi:uncharacterized protein (DUF1499 family)
MKMLGYGLVLVAVIVVGLVAWVRLAPADPAVWHVDPVTVVKPAKSNNWLVRDGADAPAVTLSMPPDQVMAKLDAIARATPRTELLADDGGSKTWITRSALMGYPDFTSIRAEPVGQGTRVTLFARARFGESDFGVNRARAENWLAQLVR